MRIWLLVAMLAMGAGALGAEPAGAPQSALFPHCWGGRGNQALYYTEGLMLRQIVLYSNPNTGQAATGVRLVFEAPEEAVEVAAAVMSDGHDRVKTEVRREAFERDGRRMVRVTCPMWDIKPGFTWKGDSPWSKWPGWWSMLYLRGKAPGRYTLSWHLESDQGNEPANTVPLVVLPRPPAPSKPAAQRPGDGVGVWLYSLSPYSVVPAVIDGLAESLAACGVRRAYLNSTEPTAIAALQARGIEVCLCNTWHYSILGPKEPPEDARAVNEKGEKVKGVAWCPTYVAERGAAWEKEVRPRVTDALRRSGADGFMLDYEGAAAPGYQACNLCFCDRCKEAFSRRVEGGLQWPADVRPDGKRHREWLGFRCDQGALYVKHIADLAREANPRARTYTWSGGLYKPYPEHRSYSQACSDITKFAPHLTAPTVGTYVYPNDLAKAFDGDPEFGKDPASWGRGLPNMIDIIGWTVRGVQPRPVIPCVSGGHTPGGSATPLAGVDLLRYQIANHLLDGVRGVDFWGTGPLQDGRYAALMAWLTDVFAEADPYLGKPGEPLKGMETAAARWRAGRLTAKEGSVVVLINGDEEARRFSVPITGPVRDLLSGERLAAKEGKVEADVEAFGARFLVSY